MGKTGHTGRLLGIWKPKLVMPRSKTKPYRRAIAGRRVLMGTVLSLGKTEEGWVSGST